MQSMVRKYWMVLIGACFLTHSCRKDREDSGTSEQPTQASPSKTPPKVVPTANHLPSELAGIRIGMTLETLKGQRKATRLKVTGAHHSSTSPNIKASDSTEVLNQKIDKADAARKKVKSAAWPGKEGLYYMQESFPPTPQGGIKHAKYTFSEGKLVAVLVYYPSHEDALRVGKGLLGVDATPKAKWERAAAKNDGLPLQAWVYKDRYALRTPANAKKSKPEPSKGPQEK